MKRIEIRGAEVEDAPLILHQLPQTGAVVGMKNATPRSRGG